MMQSGNIILAKLQCYVQLWQLWLSWGWPFSPAKKMFLECIITVKQDNAGERSLTRGVLVHQGLY